MSAADTEGTKITKKVEEWGELWARDVVPAFHRAEITPSLVRFYDLHLKNDFALPRVFVPLCGKTIDLKWLYDKGCVVVGIEFSPKAALAFFDENKIACQEAEFHGMKMLQSREKPQNLSIIIGDLFNLKSEMFETPFDLIVDRASFVAINKCDRTKYLNLLQSITHDRSRTLLLTVMYDRCEFAGPPHCIEYELVRTEYYPFPQFSVHYMGSVDCMTEYQRDNWGVHWFNEDVYLILRHPCGQLAKDHVIVEDSGWNERWQLGTTGWHQNLVHPFLPAHFVEDTVPKGLNVNSCRVLVPLCGKTVDLKWLVDLGCDVVGVELSEKAIVTFFEENPTMKYTCQDIAIGKKYQAERLTIFVCNLFEITQELVGGAFDVIWDRASLVAVNVDMRLKYVSVMQSMMHSRTSTLMSLFDYDHTKWGGPPHHMSKHELCQLYPSPRFSCRLLDKVDAMNEYRLKNWGSHFITEDAWLLCQTDGK